MHSVKYNNCFRQQLRHENNYTIIMASVPLLQPEVVAIPENMRPQPNVGSPLGQRRRRWANSQPTPGQRLMSAGMLLSYERHNIIVY